MDVRTAPIIDLTTKLSNLPRIGNKMAQKMAYHISCDLSKDEITEYINAFVNIRDNLHLCSCCYNITSVEHDKCIICESENRNVKKIMLVESAKDIVAFEDAEIFDGLYHVLHGLIDPQQGTASLDKIKLKELIYRLRGDVDELIISVSPTIEGECTTTYLTKLIKPTGIKVTTLAKGIQRGQELQDADRITLSNAYNNRKEDKN